MRLSLWTLISDHVDQLAFILTMLASSSGIISLVRRRWSDHIRETERHLELIYNNRTRYELTVEATTAAAGGGGGCAEMTVSVLPPESGSIEWQLVDTDPQTGDVGVVVKAPEVSPAGLYRYTQTDRDKMVAERLTTSLEVLQDVSEEHQVGFQILNKAVYGNSATRQAGWW